MTDGGTTGRARQAGAEGFDSFWCRSQDGLRLHSRLYGRQDDAQLPVVCLPGLARTGADFHELALAFAGHKTRPRQVIAMDYRGAASRIVIRTGATTTSGSNCRMCRTC